MLEERGKLLFGVFIAVILGVVLIQVISNDVELAKVASRTVSNETVTLTAVTGAVSNETVTLSSIGVSTGTLANNHLVSLTSLRNFTSESILGYCNVTLQTGALSCNATGNKTAYADYTYYSYSTGSLTYNELVSLTACRNSTMTGITVNTYCNVTLQTGAMRVNYDNVTTGNLYVDYTYEPDTYVHSSAARTVLTLTVLFFALAILALAVGYGWKSYNEGKF